MTNEIDWTKAPEGATHYTKETNVTSACWVKLKDDSCGYITMSHHKNNEAENIWQIGEFHTSELTVIPKPLQPVFTKAMQDNNELPPVGSECLLRIAEFAQIPSEHKSYNGDHCVIVAHVDTLAVAIVRDENSDVCFTITANHGWFKPIDTRTDKEKAIDAAIGNLMFYGDQTQTEQKANETLIAIMEGKIHGVKWVGES